MGPWEHRTSPLFLLWFDKVAGRLQVMLHSSCLEPQAQAAAIAATISPPPFSHPLSLLHLSFPLAGAATMDV